MISNLSWHLSKSVPDDVWGGSTLPWWFFLWLWQNIQQKQRKKEALIWTHTLRIQLILAGKAERPGCHIMSATGNRKMSACASFPFSCPSIPRTSGHRMAPVSNVEPLGEPSRTQPEACPLSDSNSHQDDNHDQPSHALIHTVVQGSRLMRALSSHGCWSQCGD